MNNTLLVMAGGAVGTALRYHLSRLAPPLLGTILPWGTLIANVAGGFAMGLLAGALVRFGFGGEQTRLLLGVGVLGGFTTYSAFSLETVQMIERGQPGLAIAYVLLSLIGAIGALALGLMAIRSFA